MYYSQINQALFRCNFVKHVSDYIATHLTFLWGSHKNCVYFNEVCLLKGSFQSGLCKTKEVYLKKAWIYPLGSCNKLIVNFSLTNLVRSLDLLGVQEWNDFIPLIRATSCIQSKPFLQLMEYSLNHLSSIFFLFVFLSISRRSSFYIFKTLLYSF